MLKTFTKGYYDIFTKKRYLWGLLTNNRIYVA